MVDWNAAIGRKYDILQQNADTAAMEGRANAANAAERTRLLGPTSQAAIGLQGAQTANLGAQTAGLNNLNTLPDVDFFRSATRGLVAAGGASGGSLGAGAIGAPVVTEGLGQDIGGGFLPRPAGANVLPEIRTPGFQSILNDDSRQVQERTSKDYMRLAKGTARVPGKGSPAKDTVPAMLAPGEAVLNQPAAEGLGRGLIALLNAAGQQKMGMA